MKGTGASKKSSIFSGRICEKEKGKKNNKYKKKKRRKDEIGTYWRNTNNCFSEAT